MNERVSVMGWDATAGHWNKYTKVFEPVGIDARQQLIRVPAFAEAAETVDLMGGTPQRHLENGMLSGWNCARIIDLATGSTLRFGSDQFEPRIVQLMSAHRNWELPIPGDTTEPDLAGYLGAQNPGDEFYSDYLNAHMFLLAAARLSLWMDS